MYRHSMYLIFPPSFRFQLYRIWIARVSRGYSRRLPDVNGHRTYVARTVNVADWHRSRRKIIPFKKFSAALNFSCRQYRRDPVWKKYVVSTKRIQSVFLQMARFLFTFYFLFASVSTVGPELNRLLQIGKNSSNCFMYKVFINDFYQTVHLWILVLILK